MKPFYLSHTILACLIAVLAPWNAAYAQGFATNTYTISDEDFANPERGFYRHTETWSSSPSAVPGNLASLRINGSTDPNNTYTAKLTLVLRLFYLNNFVNAPISSNFLNTIQNDFNSIRAQGFKAVVRFAYNTDDERPFDEPTKERILEHIQQLKPLLRKNCDVIAVFQQGFIGAWGEGYYTDIFYTNHQATAQHWLARTEVLNALLDALPSQRMIQVRVPQHKQKFVYGPTAASSSAALNPTNVLNGSGPARIAFHNDCFLASSTDFGTFSNYDLGGSSSSQVVANFRNYLALETRYAAMGGETCVNNPPRDDCASVGGQADSDMALYHYSFLNQGYNAAVNDDWVAQGCMADIIRRLGYRLRLISGIFRTEARPGQTIPLVLEFENVGFAAPYNPRGIELVLRNTANGQRFYAELSRDTDARRWLPETNRTLAAMLALPSDLPTGNYDLLLHLPDPEPSLYGVIPYSIRLANSNAVSAAGANVGSVWEASTGYHWLRQTLAVNNTATNNAANGAEIPVLNYSAVRENYDTWRARHFSTNNPAGAPAADADGDGRSNLLEYAVGSNPNNGNDPGYFETSFDADALVLTIRKGNGVKDVRFEMESSHMIAPESWMTSGVTVLENSPVQFRARYIATNDTGFLRLKLTLED